MKQLRVVAGAVFVAVLAGAPARAHVIYTSGPTGDPANAKLRASVAKQVAKYTSCLVKAAAMCEKKGANSGPECDLATGNVAFEASPGRVTNHFRAAVQRCDSRLELTKKGDDYHGIGCPGDCDAVAAGVQACADLPAFAATLKATSGITAPKVQLNAIALSIDVNCAADHPGAGQGDPVRKDCVENNTKALRKYSKGLYRCQAKCENELSSKDKWGNGGYSNNGECHAGSPGADPSFKACDINAQSKAGTLSPSVAANVLPVVRSVINTANDLLYNRMDPTGTPQDNPCSTCGDNSRQGAEDCDGTDDSRCAGMCNPDCTCPP